MHLWKVRNPSGHQDLRDSNKDEHWLLVLILKIPTASGLILDSISMRIRTAGYKFYLSILGII